MKKLLLLFILFQASLNAQSLYFPPLSGNDWETISPESLNWCPDSLQALVDYVGNNNSKAFIILKDGKIVTENYYNGFTATDNWYWASAGKTVTAFLVGMAQQEGLLDINEPSSNYQGNGWTDCTPQQEQAITVLNQLDMTSGLLTDGVELDCTDDTCLQYFTEPGTRWFYHNAPYTRLDKVIEGASGISFNQFYNARLKNRIGMNGLYLPSGYNNVNFSTPRSFARFGLLLLNRGVWANDTLMEDQDYFDAMINTSQDLNKSYGYLTWLNGKESYQLPGITINFPGSLMPDAPADLYAAIGRDGQYNMVIPSLNMVVIRMGEEAGGITGLVPTIMGNEIMRRIGEMDCNVTSSNHTELNWQAKILITDNTIEVQEEQCDRIELNDLQGRVITKTNGKTISTTDIKSGIYVISMWSNKSVSRQKIFIK
jgi:CubicO group peptidase (beta-lactamase class C family)